MDEKSKREFDWVVQQANLCWSGERPGENWLQMLMVSPALILDLKHELEALREDAWKYRDLRR